LLKKNEFLPPLHSSRDFAHADFKLRAAFTVILPTLAPLKNKTYIHKNIQQCIGYQDPALLLTLEYFTGPLYSLQSPKL
jgi:hypothetical protein